jgi:hypothetical protein
MDEAPGRVVTVEIDGPVTLALVDALARLHLAVRRSGGAARVLDPVPELCELVHLAGLGDVLGPLVLGREARRQPELGEPLGVEEVVDGGDLPA